MRRSAPFRLNAEAQRHFKRYHRALSRYGPGSAQALDAAADMARADPAGLRSLIAALEYVEPAVNYRPPNTLVPMAAPRTRGAGRPAARRTVATRGSPDDSEPHQPGLTLAQRRAILAFGCERCAYCGGQLFFHDGQLACANRECRR